MPKETRKPTKAWPDRKVLASPTPALLAALTALSISLRISDGSAADNGRAAGTEGANAAGSKWADANKTTKSTIHFTSTTKDKVESFSQHRDKPQPQGNQNNSHLQGTKRK